jgi:cysteinyl-tRNA synthetase
MCDAAYADSPPASFAYILQADAFGKTKEAAVAKLAACERDWVVLDAAFDEETSWLPADLEVIRKSRSGRKIIAYVSIGEAEDYRVYWKAEWRKNGKLTALAPPWMLPENPRWKGNFPVKYWNADWQQIILTSIAGAMSSGFDGVYLDIVDGFENFEQDGSEFIDNRLNPETKQSYRRDMVDWVKTIVAAARAKNPAAIVVPQNGSQLLAHPDFIQAINAIGIEDLFTEGNKVQPAEHTREVLDHLKKMADSGKPVLDIEYPKAPARQAFAREQAQKNGVTWLITDRQLRTLGSSGR